MQKALKQQKSDSQRQEENVPEHSHETKGIGKCLIKFLQSFNDFVNVEKMFLFFKYLTCLVKKEKLSSVYNEKMYDMKY